MNQTDIGKFIAGRRKEKNLTQAQLAEKLNITDRAVSKWERGKSMPDSSVMLELCHILGITVNELLSGEVLNIRRETIVGAGEQMNRAGGQTNGAGGQTNGAGEQTNGAGGQTDGEGGQTDGEGEQTNGEGERTNGEGERTNRAGKQMNREGEQMNGEKGEKMDLEKNRDNYEKKAEENLIALKKKYENGRTKNVLIAAVFSAALLIGIMVCMICDLAITGSLTWSLIPTGSIAFAWVVSFPGIILGRKGMLISLISLSAFTVPYLFLLSRILGAKEVFSIGSVMAVIAIAFMWIVAAVFRRMGKSRIPAALGVNFLLAVPFLCIVNGALRKMIGEPILDVWDLLTVFVLFILAFASFACGGFWKYGKKS